MSLGGLQGGRIFRVVPPYIDRSKPPGYSQLPQPTAADWLAGWMTVKHMIFGPNLVWFIISMAMYRLFPYDLAPTSATATGVLSFASSSSACRSGSPQILRTTASGTRRCICLDGLSGRSFRSAGTTGTSLRTT